MATFLKMKLGNAKLKTTALFDIPAGYTCPQAKDCYTKADRDTGHLKIGKDAIFRCYAASSENRYPNVRKLRWHNYDLLKGKSVSEMATLIIDSVRLNSFDDIERFRIHSSGDFFSQDYFDAWIEVAKHYPNVLFYAYTKALSYWIARLDVIPTNIVLTASKGGKMDDLIERHNLKFVEVVYSIEEANEKGLKLDEGDKLAYSQNLPFAILIHGSQPKGSKAGLSVAELRRKGIFGYSDKKKELEEEFRKKSLSIA